MVQLNEDNNYRTRLERSHRIAAKVVSLYGDDYLPIFIRLQEEVDRYDHRVKMRDVARQVTIHTLKAGKKDIIEGTSWDTIIFD